MGISCLLYQPKLAALGSGELPELLSKRVERHLSTCPSCQSEWELQQHLIQALRGASPSPAPVSPFLWERLEAAIEAEVAPAATAPSFRRHRLVPVGGFLLAGAAIAAVFVTRAPQTSPPLQTPSQVAFVEPNRDARPSHALKIKSALELAQNAEHLVAQNQAPSDPFAITASAVEPRSHPTLPPGTPAERIRRTRQSRSENHQPTFVPVKTEMDIPRNTRVTAVAQLEHGAVHLQTAEFNREVQEAEEQSVGPAQRVTCAPTEAIASARGEANLGMFQ